MRVRTGTSGFSYAAWKGAFYPDEIRQNEMLGYYSGRLGSVEINNTFYRLPRRSVLEGWSAQVGDDFRFVLKASRRITHFKRLKPEALDETGYLAETTAVMGDKLGAVLMQLPPNFPADADRLSAYLDGVPTGMRIAFEFRHPSWLQESVYSIIRAHGHAVCVSEADGQQSAPIEASADWGYLRLRLPQYSERDLDRWAEALAASGWREAFVFFKHEDAASGPLVAESFRRRFG